MMDWVKQRLSFSGRASPREAMSFVALCLIAFVPAYVTQEVRLFFSATRDVFRVEVQTSLLSSEAVQRVERRQVSTFYLFKVSPGVFSIGAVLILVWPAASVFVRRLHDLDRPVWQGLAALFCAFGLVPFLFVMLDLLFSLSVPTGGALAAVLGFPSLIVSILALLILMMWIFAEGDPDENRFGPPPQKVTS